ncbi:MAG: VOC family protein [Saprospiraceae bacterium]|nr:VOC family protein [Saprospiraceae bacterium]
MKIIAANLRFTYSTDKYDETYDFYENKLNFNLGHSWDRNENEKGAVFKIGEGLIEILKRPIEDNKRHIGLDYRAPQGVFAGIQVWDIDKLFETYKSNGVPIKENIFNQPWGHRSFYVEEPNGLVISFYEEQF